MSDQILSHDEVLSILDYDQETGLFKWKKARHGRQIGKIAGTKTHNGYIQICITTDKARAYLAHRIAWLYVYGEFPSMAIDHINGIKTDNRIVNLRLATTFQNAHNLRKHKSRSKSGLLGVCTEGNRYRARIRVHGKDITIGSFSTPEEAHNAYLEAKRKHHDYCEI